MDTNMTFASGKTFYDADSALVNNIAKEMDTFKGDVTGIVESHKEETRQAIGGVKNDIDTLTYRCGDLTWKTRDITKILYTFLNSRFVRFLNFFACWFIYPPKGSTPCVYLNNSENEQYGKAPLLTRAKRSIVRWCREMFLKSDSEKS